MTNPKPIETVYTGAYATPFSNNGKGKNDCCACGNFLERSCTAEKDQIEGKTDLIHWCDKEPDLCAKRQNQEAEAINTICPFWVKG